MILIVELSGVLFILMPILAMKSVMLSIDIFVTCWVFFYLLVSIRNIMLMSGCIYI